jgi:phage terminase large subunit
MTAALWPEQDQDEQPLFPAFERSAPSPHLSRYQADPIAWMVERMGVPERTLRWSLNPGYDAHRWDGARDPLVAICEALAQGKSVGVESATGTQKTYTAALIVLWFLDCFEDSLVPTAAPREKQLTLHLWKEIGRLWPRFQWIRPEAELTQLRIRMRPGSDVWSAQGFATGVGADEESATKAQGFHAEHMLIVMEETPGIDAAILTAFENTCTAPHNLRLALGNPDHQLDQLHLFCQSPGVVAVRMSALDHPNVVSGDANVVPGAAARESLERRLEKYGEDHPIYQSRSRGISPTEATDALIKLSWCAKAQGFSERGVGPAAMGVDVANSIAGDEAAIADGVGAVLDNVTAFACPDANELARLKIVPRLGRMLAQDRVGVDSVGVGAGTVNEAKRLKHTLVSLNGGERPWHIPGQEEVFFNLRAQMWWQMAQDLQHGRVGLPKDEELYADLTTPKWGTRNGKIFVESKEDLQKRLPGGRSPNKGDAAVYWNWVRQYRRGSDRLPRLSTSYHSG